MDDEARVLFEMFPDLPDETLSSVWRRCNSDFSAAVDEALTISSLQDLGAGNAIVPVDDVLSYRDSEQSHQRHPEEEPQPQELWEDASLFYNAPSSDTIPSALHPPPLPHQEHIGKSALSSQGRDETQYPRSADLKPTDDSVYESRPQAQLEHPLASYGLVTPGEPCSDANARKEMPRRGTVVPLPPHFLRAPTRATSPNEQAAAVPLEQAAAEPLIDLSDNSAHRHGARVQFSPLEPSTSTPTSTPAPSTLITRKGRLPGFSSSSSSSNNSNNSAIWGTPLRALTEGRTTPKPPMDNGAPVASADATREQWRPPRALKQSSITGGAGPSPSSEKLYNDEGTSAGSTTSSGASLWGEDNDGVDGDDGGRGWEKGNTAVTTTAVGYEGKQATVQKQKRRGSKNPGPRYLVAGEPSPDRGNADSITNPPSSGGVGFDGNSERRNRDVGPDDSFWMMAAAGSRGRRLLEIGRNDVETATAAGRIAGFRPGTRFRVAVDKGVTGLGITVKEIRGRFFVYRLQPLADGSPGAAEEAGVRAGDELLGVEELDFETERWDMDQLVSYMGELVGVVILHMMRGLGPLPRAASGDVEKGMSRGVAQVTNEESESMRDATGTARDGAAGRRNGARDGVRNEEWRARRLIEVLEEEELLQPSEAGDVSRLYCQISDRAIQWDTGELWLSVADMARRPPREIIAALANQWSPGEPVGWDDSDTTDSEPSPMTTDIPRGGWLRGAQAGNAFRSDGRSGATTPFSTAGAGATGTNCSSNGRASSGTVPGGNNANGDPSADLDEIGEALLGQPLFSDDPLSGEWVGTAAAIRPRDEEALAFSSSASAAATGGQRDEAGPRTPQQAQPDTVGDQRWSPWPHLVALETKAARRRTVVPTQGLRKALNVRVLGGLPTPAPLSPLTQPSAPARHEGDNNTSSNGDHSSAQPSSTSYLVWVMDVESGAEWRVRRSHAEFAELRDVCTGMRPSLARLDFPPWLPEVKDTPGMVEARRPRLEGYLHRLCSLLYMGPLHPSSAHVAHLLQDFLGTSPRVETLGRLQRSRPDRELRQALQVRAWQILRLPPLERVVAELVKDIVDGPASARSKKAAPAEATLKRLTEVMERLQYVVTEGCFDELREMVPNSMASTPPSSTLSEGANKGKHASGDASGDALTRDSQAEEGRVQGENDGREINSRGADAEGNGNGETPDWAKLAAEDEALELISGSVRRQVEAELFVPVMGRVYKRLRMEGETARLEKNVALGIEAARGKPQSAFGIPLSSVSPSNWNGASKLLRAVGSFTLPCDKVDALIAVAHAIPALHRTEHPGDSADSLGADDFLPIFIYALVNSGVEGMAAQSAVVEALCDPKKMIGEAGFCVATLTAALLHLGRPQEDRSRKGTISSLLLGRRK